MRQILKIMQTLTNLEAEPIVILLQVDLNILVLAGAVPRVSPLVELGDGVPAPGTSRPNRTLPELMVLAITATLHRTVV